MAPVGSNSKNMTNFTSACFQSQVKGIIQNAAEKEQDTAVSANVLNDKNCEKQNFDSIQSYQAWGVLQRENIPPHALNQGPDHFQKRLVCYV